MNFSYDDILPLARGAAFLGSGGGGNTDYADLLLKKQIRKYGSIRMIDFFDLNDDDIVVPIGFMGAPLVEKEKLCGTKELISLIDRIEKMYGKNIAALCPAEIGGSNAFTPLFIAAQRNIPVLDADMLGRAFPELSMVSTHAQGIFPEITFMADSFGNIIEIRCSDFFRLEEYARAITVACGSSSALVIQVLTGKQVKKGALIQKSLSNALQIGRVLLQHDCPSNVTVCARGIINDIDQEIADGF